MQQVPKVKMSLLKYYWKALHDPIELRSSIFKKYGDIASIRVHGIDNYLISNPEHIKHILQDQKNIYFYKHPFLRETFSPFVGTDNIFISNNFEEWHRARLAAIKMLDPQVHFEEYTKTITSECLAMLNHWNDDFLDGQCIDVNNEIAHLMIKIISKTIFTQIEFDNDIIDTINTTIKLIRTKIAIAPTRLWNFLPIHLRYDKQLDNLRNMFKNIVRKRLHDQQQWDDMLGHLLLEYQNLPEAELIEKTSYQITILFAVSYFTTSSLIHWNLIMISNYPEMKQQILSEISTIVDSRAPSYAEIASFTYLGLFIKEVLRLHPPSFAIMRQTMTEDIIGNYLIPQNAGITISTAHAHRHPEFWINPDNFNPERFRDNPLGQQHPFAYIPFGGGQRGCIGAAFSTLEASIITILILQRFHLYLPSNTIVNNRYTTLISMSPNTDKMILKFK